MSPSPARSPHLVGRVEASRVVRRALGDALAGRPTFLLIEGDPGVGRRRLLEDALEGMGQQAIRRLRLPRDHAGRPPGELLADACRRLARTVPDGPERAHLVAAVERLEHDPISAARAVRILLELVGLVTDDRVTVVEIDDPAPDDSSLPVFLAALAAALADEPVLVAVVASRAVAARGPALRAWLRDMAGDGRTRWVVLEPLDAVETGELAAAILGAPLDPGALARLVARSAGEPLVIEALLDGAVSGGDPDPVRGGSLVIPPGLRAVLHADLGDLDGAARDAVTVVAVIGRAADPRLVTATMERTRGTDEASGLAAVRVALDHRVLIRSEGSSLLAIRRPLLAEVVRDGLLPPERRTLDRAIAACLDADPSLGGTDPGGAATEAAIHWQRAGRATEALASALQAEAAHEAAEAFPEALRDRELILELLPAAQVETALPSDVELEHVLRAEAAATRAGDAAAGVRHARRALALIDPRSEPMRAAALEGDLAYHLWVDGRAEEALAAHQRAIRLVPARPPSRARAKALRKHAGALLGLGRYREAARAATVARDAARAAGALDEEGRSLDMLGMARVGTGRLSAGIAALMAAVTIARDHDPGEAHIVGCYNLAYHLLLADRPTDAIGWARQGSEAAQNAGLGERFGPYLAGVETDALTRAGRLAEAAAVVTRARRSGDPDGRSLYLVTAQIRLEVLRGRRTAAEQAEREAVAIAAEDIDFDQVAFLDVARAELALLVGEDLRALEHARAGAAALDGRDDRFVGPLVASVQARALGRLARTARTNGDLEASARWAREAASLVVGDRGTRGLAALADLVELERARIEGADRPAAWRGLARRWLAMEQPLRAADAWLREAEAWAFRGGSRRRIAGPLQRACDVAEASGAAALRGEIQTLARRCRVELDGAPQDDAAGALLRQDRAMELDPAERSILELLELGRPVSDVARTTGIPVTRVRSMLSELRARARVPSDAALLDAAARLGLVRVGPGAAAVGPRPERAERTFLFADIVGSTALLEAMGDDAWAGVRTWFDSTMRRAIAAHGGQEVDHTGDGFFVAFESGAAGLACAVEMMRTLERHRRTSGFAPALRVGIHAGEARLDGKAYVGRTVHLAARLLGIAEAGEIVASGSVVAATGWPAVGPARSVLLKGVSEPVEVMSVRWAG